MKSYIASGEVFTAADLNARIAWWTVPWTLSTQGSSGMIEWADKFEIVYTLSAYDRQKERRRVRKRYRRR